MNTIKQILAKFVVLGLLIVTFGPTPFQLTEAKASAQQDPSLREAANRTNSGEPKAPIRNPASIPEFLPEGANCSSPVVLDDQWSSGFRLVCQNNLYVLMVDLTNPAIKVDVMAASSGTRTVSSFADSNTVAMINADYQWCASGAICSQGLTISNGSNPTTYTNISHLCSDARVRREIGFSQDGHVVIDWWYRFVSDGQAKGWCGSIPGSGGGLEQYSYNLVGGGPQFTFDGSFHWDCQYGQDPTTHNCLSSGGDVGINGEHFGIGDWWNRYQSAIGYTSDGTVLVLGESNNQTHSMQDVHDIMYQRLSAYGKTLKNAFKFDGGSKAGFWYYNSNYSSTPNVYVPNVIRIQRTNSTCYSLSTNINPGGSGSISVNTPSNCAQGKYSPGTSVQLTANANSGYAFSNWSGNAGGNSNPISITMDGNKSVTANFTSNTTPDLIIQSITASPSNPSANQPVTFTVRLKNQGSGNASSSFYVDFFIDNPPGNCPTDGITYWTIPSLSAGATQDLTYNYTGFTSSGTHNLYAFADSYCYISENNENNNILGPIAVSVQSPGVGKDTTGVFRPTNGALYLKNSNTTGSADVAINYGMPGDKPVTGDWNGDGVDTIGVYRNGVFYLRNSNSIGIADVYFAFGAPGDQPIAGDWDGNGTDTIGVYRSSTGTFYLRNTNSSGAADMIFQLGIPGDVGIAGDWNGDGMDTTGVFRPSNGYIFLKNQNSSGYADIGLNFGIPGDKPVAGDWDNNGTDTIGVYRNGTFYLRNSNTPGYADVAFSLGIPGDLPIAGNWDGLP